MDLLLLVVVVVVVGFIVWLLTTQVPLPPYWATAVQVFALIVLALWLVGQIGERLPRILH